MDVSAGQRLDLGELLTAVEDAPPVAAADVVGEVLAELMGASAVAFLIADFSGDALIRLGHSGAKRAGPDLETTERVILSGSPHGEVLAGQSIRVARQDAGWQMLAPVTNRGEAIGVLELWLPVEPDAQAEADVALAAHALAYIVIANRRFTDLFEWGQRSVPLSLAAEIQHRLLPAVYTCEAAQFTMAAWLEPAGDIAGDTFDFSLDRDALHLSMTDAMGHHIEAAVLATILVGAVRNARRAGVGLAEQARRASLGVAEYFHRCEYVTGQMVEVDLRSGTAEIVNAGHPLPLRLRDGVVTEIQLEPDLPFGLGEHHYRLQALELLPGDRVIFVTDGLLERHASSVNIKELILDGAEMHAREAVQHLIRAVVRANGGKLKDDATVMFLDWIGGPNGLRTSSAGSNE